MAPRRTFQPVLDHIYATTWNRDVVAPGSEPINPQALALIFALLAIGAQHNPDLPPNDPSADEYLGLSQACLVKGNFLVETTLMGVQTLILMAHYHSDSRNGDSAWPLWGLAMRQAIAMGLHRDGERWNLEVDISEERR